MSAEAPCCAESEMYSWSFPLFGTEVGDLTVENEITPVMPRRRIIERVPTAIRTTASWVSALPARFILCENVVEKDFALNGLCIFDSGTGRVCI